MRTVTRVVPWVFVTGCFLITAGEVDQHDKLLGPGGDADADADADADSDADGDADPDGNSTPETAVAVTDPLGSSRQCATGDLGFEGDVDWYDFQGAGGRDIVLITTIAQTADPPSDADTLLESDAGGRSDDSTFGIDGFDSTLSIAPGAKVSVTDAHGAGGASFGYQVCGQLVQNRDVEPNDQWNAASNLGSVGDNFGVQVGGQWDGDPDVFAFDTRPGSVYLVALTPGHTIDNARLHLLDPSTGAVIRTSIDPTYDDHPWGAGYPPDAGLMIGPDPVGSALVEVDGGASAAGPYVLAILELDEYRVEVEYNDTPDYAQTASLYLQPNGDYYTWLTGTLNPFNDGADTFVVDPPQSVNDWVVDIVVQSASVGTDQDLALVVSDPDSGEQLATIADDPGSWIGLDPAALGVDLTGHGRILFQIALDSDEYWSSDPWYATVRVREP